MMVELSWWWNNHDGQIVMMVELSWLLNYHDGGIIMILMVVYDDDFRAEVEEFFHEMDRDFDGRLSFEV